MTSTATTSTATAPADEPTTDASTDASTEEFVYLDPGSIIIGSNVRTDLPDAKEFRRSIKERGVLEAVTVYRNDEGQYVCLRGQRRTVEAASVGTPTGLIPARVVAKPEEADRIVDQMVENIHRAGMRETEIVAGVEELTLVGVSPDRQAALRPPPHRQRRDRGHQGRPVPQPARLRRPDPRRGRDLRGVRARPRRRRAPGAAAALGPRPGPRGAAAA